MALYPLDGPSVETTINVTTTQIELKVGASAYEDRKVVTIQPQDGKVRVAFVSGANGMLVVKNQIVSFEASATQPLYIKAVTGTVAVEIAERA